MTDSDDEIALIEQQLAQRKERKRARDDEQRRREALLPKQLVPDSPSPRKKRRPSTDASTLLARTPPPPRFFEKSPLERTFNPSDKVEMRSARGGTKGSKFESHLSAVPKGFAQIMSNSISVARAEQDKKRAVEERRRQSRQSALASSSSTSLVKLDQLDKEAREVLMSGKKGEGAMLRPRKEKEKEGKGAREKEKALLAATSTASFTKPTTTTPAISRATPSTSSKLAPSSSSFGSIRPSTPAVDDSLEITDGPSRRTRNKDGTVINEIEIGPWEFPARADDPEWEKVEPYSGIRLRERLIPHSAIQDLLTGRYPLLPSLLYALSRIDSRNRIELNHEVVDADYVVFGVLAWKDEVRFLNGGVGRGQGGGEGKKEGEEGNGEESNEEELVTDGKGKKKASSTSASQDPLFRPPTRRSRRLRYIRFDLIDLSTPRASASATGQLSLMLVQADSVDKAVDEDGNEMEVYKGQSGGAYERYWKESPGAVVAIVNPIFLPHNKAYSYTIKPTSADSVHVIGRAENLTFCEAIKKDGRQCGKWVDARTGKFCQFHVELAIKRTGVRRSETNANTASLAQKGTFNHSHFKKSLGSSSTSSGSLDSAAPAQQPLAKFVAGSTTYVTTGTRSSTITMPRGGLLSTSSSSSRAGGFIHGLREGPSVLDEKKRLKKVVEDEKRAREERKQLRRLDKGRTAGGEYLIRSSRRVKTEGDGKGEKRGKKRKRTPDDEDDDEPSEARGASAGSSSDEEDEDVKPNLSSVFKADALRKIGFNPTAKPGDLPRDESSETKRYRLALESGLAHREIKLSAPKPPPKPKVKSRVAEAPAMNTDDDDLVIEGGPG